jgi:hypothetical protein
MSLRKFENLRNKLDCLLLHRLNPLAQHLDQHRQSALPDKRLQKGDHIVVAELLQVHVDIPLHDVVDQFQVHRFRRIKALQLFKNIFQILFAADGLFLLGDKCQLALFQRYK